MTNYRCGSIMNNKNLLVISEGYPYKNNIHSIFVKGRVDYLKKTFRNVFIVSPIAYFPKNSIKLSYNGAFFGYSDVPENYSYGNVRVFFPKYFPLPTNLDFFSRCRLKLGFTAVNKIIKKRES